MALAINLLTHRATILILRVVTSPEELLSSDTIHQSD